MPGFPANLPDTGDGVERRHALVVGVDHYLAPTPRLDFCAKDALAIGKALRARDFHVVEVHDGPRSTARPTRAAVEDAIARLVQDVDDDDLVVAYFSCHGVLAEQRPHLLLADTLPDDVAGTGLALSEVLRLLGDRHRWGAVFLDACHMGLGLDPAVSRSTGQVNERDGGFALLAGSTSKGITQDTKGAGVFSKHLLRGLLGAAQDPDGGVRFSVLARHVQDRLAEWRGSREGQDRASRQTPVLRLEVADIPLLKGLGYIELRPKLPAKIRAAAFSPDGRQLATGCEDGTARLWDPATGRQVLTEMVHDGRHHVGGVAFSPDGILLATACNDGWPHIWQAPGANELWPRPEQGDAVHAVAWAPEGLILATAAHDGVHVYVGDGFGILTDHRHLDDGVGVGTVFAVAFAPDGRLITGGKDGAVRTWNVATGRCESVWRHDEGPVWAVAVSPDGKRVVSGGTDPNPTPTLLNEVRVWNRKTGKVVKRLSGHGAGVTAIAFNQRGDRLATSSYDGRARLWATADWSPLFELGVEVGGRAHRPQAYAVAFSPGGDTLFVGFADGRGRLFDLTDQRWQSAST